MSKEAPLLTNPGLQDSSWSAPAAPARVTGTLLLMASIASLPAMQYGWCIGVINFPASVIGADLGIDTNAPAWSVGVVALFAIAGFLGSHLAGGWSDSMGRRRLLIALNVPFLLAGIMCVVAGLLKGTTGYWLLVASRVLSGFAAGAGSVVTPMYLGEVATLETKGAFGALFQLQICLFILFVQVAGAPGVAWSMSTPSLWGAQFGVSGAFAVMGLLGAPLLLESPRWLLKQGRRAEALAALAALRGVREEQAEVELAASEGEDGSVAADPEAAVRGAALKAPMSLAQVLSKPTLRKPLLVCVVLMVVQQFSGINAVFYYSDSFFKDAKVNSTVGTIGAGAVNLLATMLAISLIERMGRKPLVLTGIGGMGLSTVGLIVTLQVKAGHPDSATLLGYIAIVFVLCFVAFFEVGLGAIPWAIGGEIFPTESRGAAMALAAAVNWVCTMLVGVLFPILNKALPNGLSFLPFAATLGLGFVFAVAYVPETKGKTPAEIVAGMNGGYDAVPAGGEDPAEGAEVRIKGLRR